jgi:hypothetical protein
MTFIDFWRSATVIDRNVFCLIAPTVTEIPCSTHLVLYLNKGVKQGLKWMAGLTLIIATASALQKNG